jgi:hypothetical protein
MAIYGFRTSTYARNIYLYGNTNFASIPVEYHEPVKQHAAASYSEYQIVSALQRGWITQEEYDQTMAYAA